MRIISYAFYRIFPLLVFAFSEARDGISEVHGALSCDTFHYVIRSFLSDSAKTNSAYLLHLMEPDFLLSEKIFVKSVPFRY